MEFERNVWKYRLCSKQHDVSGVFTREFVYDVATNFIIVLLGLLRMIGEWPLLCCQNDHKFGVKYANKCK